MTKFWAQGVEFNRWKLNSTIESWISPLKVIFHGGIQPLKVEYYRWKWNPTFNFSICINRSRISCRVNSQQTTNPITRITVKVSKDNHWDIHWINPLRHIYPQVQLTIPQTFVLIDILWTLTLDYTSLYKVLFNRLTKFPTNHLVTSYTKTDLLFTLWIVSLWYITPDICYTCKIPLWSKFDWFVY